MESSINTKKIGTTITKEFENIKDAISNSIKSSKLGQSIAKAATTTTGKTIGKIVGPVADSALDIAFGGVGIAESAKSTMTTGQKAYAITGDVVGIGANIGVSAAISSGLGGGAATTAGTTLAVGAATGPGIIIAIAAIIAQVLGGILDGAWNPFKNYFNRDLADIRKSYDEAIKNQMINLGMNWPIEVKPDLIGTLLGNEDNIKEYQKYLKQYYDDNQLISEEEFLNEAKLFLDLRKLRRFTTKFTLDKNGEYILKSPALLSSNVQAREDETLLQIQSDLDDNMLLLLALTAHARKIKSKTQITPSVSNQYIQENYLSILISIILIILLSSFMTTIF